MGYYYSFHVEVRTDNEWHVPQSLVPQSKWSRAGEFLCQSAKQGSMDLFFCRDALFPFTAEIPPQWESSALYSYFAEFYSFQENDWHISWIAYDALFVDDWRSERVLVSGRVNGEQARHFGDGAGAFPEEALLCDGMHAWKVQRLRCGSLTEEPINRSYGKRRYELENVETGTLVQVTWRDTVWNYLGDEAATAFLNLRRFGEDADLRVIVTLS